MYMRLFRVSLQNMTTWRMSRFSREGRRRVLDMDVGTATYCHGIVYITVNRCSKLEKKTYFPVFLLTGFVGFDGEF